MRLEVAVLLLAQLIATICAQSTEPAFVYLTNFLILNSTTAKFDATYNSAFEAAIAKGLKLENSDVTILESKQQSGSSLVPSNDIVASANIRLPLRSVPQEYKEDEVFLREYLTSRLVRIVSKGFSTSDFRLELTKRGVTDNTIVVAAFNVPYPDDDTVSTDSLLAASGQDSNLTELIVILCVILGFIAFATFLACSCRLYYLYRTDPKNKEMTIHGLEENRMPDLQFEYVVDESTVQKDRPPSVNDKSISHAMNKMNAMHNAKDKPHGQEDLDLDLNVDLGLDFGVGEVESSAGGGSARSSLSNSRCSSNRSSFSRQSPASSTRNSDNKSTELSQLRELGASQDVSADMQDIGTYLPPKPRKVEDRSRAKNVKMKFETMIATNVDESTGEPTQTSSIPEEEIQINWV
jgi:hypothetical protein